SHSSLSEHASASRKLDLAFRFGRNAVAGCGTIPPAAKRLQNVAIAKNAAALQNEGAMHAPVGTDDEADLHFGSGHCRGDQRVGGSQGLGGPAIFAAGAGADVWHIRKFGSTVRRLPDLVFALGQHCVAHIRNRSLHRSGSVADSEDEKPGPEATKHT